MAQRTACDDEVGTQQIEVGTPVHLKFGRRELAKLGLIAGSAHYFRGASLRSALAADVAGPRTTP